VGSHHHVPEPPNIINRLYLVAGAVVDEHRRISRPRELDQRVVGQPSRSDTGLLLEGALML
jgi:hypothetical protein